MTSTGMELIRKRLPHDNSLARHASDIFFTNTNFGLDSPFYIKKHRDQIVSSNTKVLQNVASPTLAGPSRFANTNTKAKTMTRYNIQNGIILEPS